MTLHSILRSRFKIRANFRYIFRYTVPQNVQNLGKEPTTFFSRHSSPNSDVSPIENSSRSTRVLTHPVLGIIFPSLILKRPLGRGGADRRETV